MRRVHLAVAGALLLGACSVRRSELLSGPLSLERPVQARGERVFARHCHQCHPRGNAGLGPSPARIPLPPFAIRLQVRCGLGAMPAFPDTELSDDDLAAIIAYLDAVDEL